MVGRSSSHSMRNNFSRKYVTVIQQKPLKGGFLLKIVQTSSPKRTTNFNNLKGREQVKKFASS
jgi:hypothetical protein